MQLITHSATHLLRVCSSNFELHISRNLV